jgi:hypothetical protein
MPVPSRGEVGGSSPTRQREGRTVCQQRGRRAAWGAGWDRHRRPPRQIGQACWRGARDISRRRSQLGGREEEPPVKYHGRRCFSRRDRHVSAQGPADGPADGTGTRVGSKAPGGPKGALGSRTDPRRCFRSRRRDAGTAVGCHPGPLAGRVNRTGILDRHSAPPGTGIQRHQPRPWARLPSDAIAVPTVRHHLSRSRAPRLSHPPSTATLSPTRLQPPIAANLARARRPR